MSEELNINDDVVSFFISNTKVKNGDLKYSVGGQSVNWENVQRKLMTQRLSITPAEFEQLRDVLITEHEANRVAVTEGGQFFDDPISFCEHFMDQWKVRVATDGTILYGDEDAGDVTTAKASIVNRLKIELHNYNRNIPVDPETGNRVVAPLAISELIQASVDRIVAKVRLTAIGETRKAIAYDKNSDFPLDEWVTELFDVYGINYKEIPAHITMFKHMLYTIKRGIFSLRGNERRPMHIFYSRKQATGKTTLLEKLCSPFPYAYSEGGKLHKLLDGKAFKAMVRDRVLVDFQELATPNHIRNARGEIDQGIIADIKSAITSKTVEERGMYTHENEREIQLATFASSSNIHIFDVLQDPGGMRRYWEYVLEPNNNIEPKDKWERANKLFKVMTEVYKCIDESDSLGYYYDGCPDFNEIEKIQENYSKADAFSKFCEMTKIHVQSSYEDGYSRVQIPSLVKKFNRFQEKQGNRAWTASSLLILMSQKDIIPEIVEENGKNIEIVYVKEDV